MLLASAATVAAVALMGCDTETLTKSNLRAKQPLSPKILAEIEHKGMAKETPILVRLFKEEAELEVWKQTKEGRYALLKTYPICRWSGELGPKIRQGDRQAPEGFYTITPGQMNPNSSYYLAFNMGYPNAYDRAHGRTGSELMVHGDCSSRGCYAMTDEQMGEIYALARESFFGGQRSFQVQAFPFRMTPVNMARHRANPHMRFWKMLKEGYDHFEVTRLEPKVDVCERHYVFNAESQAAFSASGKCPAYNIPADILAAVREKGQRDEVRTAELVNFTPAAPIKTGSDGGMNSVYLAALKPATVDGYIVHSLAATPHGTIPSHVNPPQAAQPVYASRQQEADGSRLFLASAELNPESAAPGGGFFGRMTRALQGGPEPEPQELVGRPRMVDVSARRAPEPKPQIATAPSPRPAAAPKQEPAVAAATPRPQEPAGLALRGSSPTPAAQAAPPPRPATTAALRPTTVPSRAPGWARPAAAAPAPSMSSPSTMTALTGPVIRGAQPALPAGSFENRWSALR
jgi:murein L,D-transpeptidase YafK